jgi:glycosyltransferase XagB
VSLLGANATLAVLAALAEGGVARKTALVFTYPLYWLLISAAAYRALWQLLRDPFRWEKTPHGAADP